MSLREKGGLRQWCDREPAKRSGLDMAPASDADDISTLGENDEGQTNTQLRMAMPEAEDPGASRPNRCARVEDGLLNVATEDRAPRFALVEQGQLQVDTEERAPRFAVVENGFLTEQPAEQPRKLSRP